MKLDIYARVSTIDQNVKQQVEHLLAYCQKNKIEAGLVVADEESGRLPLIERRKFLKLLEQSKTTKSNGLLIFNLDRLTRNWDDVVLIERHFREHWGHYTLTSTADEINLSNANGRFMFRVKMAVNCLMPEDMIEKQKIGIERAKREGKYKFGRGRPKYDLGRGLTKI